MERRVSNMSKKWNIISELCEKIYEDDMLDGCGEHLKCIGYAPWIGYRSWIFSYKGVLVALFDVGNGHYDFHTAVTWIDMMRAKILDRIESYRFRKSREKR